MKIINKLKTSTNKCKEIEEKSSFSSFFRPLSFYFSIPFIKFNPNFLSLIMIIINILALAFLCYGSYNTLIIGSLLVCFSFFFDYVDGNVARYQGKTSIRGKYLDFISMIIITSMIYIALGIGVFRMTGQINYLYLGLIITMFHLFNQSTRLFKYLISFRNKIEPKYNPLKNNLIKKIINLTIFFPYVSIYFIIFSIIGKIHYLLIFYGILIPLFVIAKTIREYYYWMKIDKSNKKEEKNGTNKLEK